MIADYLCERISGEHAAASDVTDLEFAREDDLDRFHLTETALRILHKAFAMQRRARQVRRAGLIRNRRRRRLGAPPAGFAGGDFAHVPPPLPKSPR